MRRLYDMCCERLHGPLVHIMLETDVRVPAAIAAHRTIKNVHACLDRRRAVVVVVQSIDIPSDDVIAQRAHVGQARASAVAVRGPHVRREIAKDVLQEAFEERHLLSPPGRVERVQILVLVCMRTDLVSLGYHAT